VISKKCKNLESYLSQTLVIYISFNKNFKLEEFLIENSKKNSLPNFPKIIEKNLLVSNVFLH